MILDACINNMYVYILYINIYIYRYIYIYVYIHMYTCYANRYPTSHVPNGNIPVRDSPHPAPLHAGVAANRVGGRGMEWGRSVHLCEVHPLWIYFHIGYRTLIFSYNYAYVQQQRMHSYASVHIHIHSSFIRMHPRASRCFRYTSSWQ